jgi:hypothetical protein
LVAGAIALGAVRPCLAGAADARLLPDQVQTQQPGPASAPSTSAESAAGQLDDGAGATLEIPQAVKGCWETVTGAPDSFQHIKGPPLAWLSSTRTLCFIETPAHSFQITYQATSADIAGAAARGDNVSDFKSMVQVVGSDRKGDFTLRSVSSSNQNMRSFLRSYIVEYTTTSTLNCKFAGDALIAQASAFSSCTGAPSYCDGAPLSTSTTRIEFHRVDTSQ